MIAAYQFRERHSRRVHATPERIHRAIWEVTADEIFLFRALIWIRGFGRPLPPSILNVPRETSVLGLATRTTFLTLIDSVREVVVGTVVARPARTPRPANADELFAVKSRPGYVVATPTARTCCPPRRVSSRPIAPRACGSAPTGWSSTSGAPSSA